MIIIICDSNSEKMMAIMINNVYVPCIYGAIFGMSAENREIMDAPAEKSVEMTNQYKEPIAWL